MLIGLLLLGVFCFGFVVLFGAPYVPTLKKQQIVALKLLDLKPGQTLLELGSGDGRVLNAAAAQGIKAIGYELNPLLFIASKVLTWRNRKLVTVHFGNYWNKRWPETDGVYVFLLDKYMSKLHKKITHQYSGKKVKVVSFAFEIPQQTPIKSDKGLFLYEYK